MHYAWPEDGLDITTYIKPHLHTSLLPPGHTVTNWRTGCMHYAWPEDGLAITTTYNSLTSIPPSYHMAIL